VSTLGLDLLPDRCARGFHATQHPQLCTCLGGDPDRLKAQGQARANAAHPDERAKVEAAIRQLAATGNPFSANDARKIHGVKGGVVGGVFSALHTEGVIKPCGMDKSNSGPTHGHHIFLWEAAA